MADISGAFSRGLTSGLNVGRESRGNLELLLRERQRGISNRLAQEEAGRAQRRLQLQEAQNRLDQRKQFLSEGTQFMGALNTVVNAPKGVAKIIGERTLTPFFTDPNTNIVDNKSLKKVMEFATNPGQEEKDAYRQFVNKIFSDPRIVATALQNPGFFNKWRTDKIGALQDLMTTADSFSTLDQREAARAASRASEEASQAARDLRRRELEIKEAAAPLAREKTQAEIDKLNLDIEKGELELDSEKRLQEFLTDPGSTTLHDTGNVVADARRDLVTAGKLIRLGTDKSRKLGTALQSHAKTLLETPEAQGAVEAAKERAKVEGRLKAPLTPNENKFLGFARNTKTTREELADRGITVPSEKEQERLTEKRRAAQGVVRLSNTIVGRVKGRPEVIGQPGRLTRFMRNISSSLKGFARLLPGLDERLGIEKERGDLIDQAIKAAGITNRLVASEVKQLAFMVAASFGQAGRGLSDRDLQIVTDIIGGMEGDPEAMEAVLKTLAFRQSQGYIEEYRDAVGFSPKVPGIPNPDQPFAEFTDAQLAAVGRFDNLLSRREKAQVASIIRARLNRGSAGGLGIE